MGAAARRSADSCSGDPRRSPAGLPPDEMQGAAAAPPRRSGTCSPRSWSRFLRRQPTGSCRRRCKASRVSVRAPSPAGPSSLLPLPSYDPRPHPPARTGEPRSPGRTASAPPLGAKVAAKARRPTPSRRDREGCDASSPASPPSLRSARSGWVRAHCRKPTSRGRSSFPAPSLVTADTSTCSAGRHVVGDRIPRATRWRPETARLPIAGAAPRRPLVPGDDLVLP